MTDVDSSADAALSEMKARADFLEQRLQEVELSAVTRVRHAELRVEATRAGIVDIDGLKLLDSAVLSGGADAGFDAADIVERLRKDKPWLFSRQHSSSIPSAPPSAAPTKRRMATDMTLEEWRVARADLIRRR